MVLGNSGSGNSGSRKREQRIWEQGKNKNYVYLIRVKSAIQTSNFFFRAFRLPTPDSRLPTPDSQLPTPDSRLPTPDSRLPQTGV
ncbi:MAG: hypothetical protein F6J90_39295 [Moorea sp. SIOASIH]|uniref:hypothetical protein n=1 Tax=Moorena sp. SIOASIH TaxID=2607817 RepID=UPI0013BAC25E|nr:hypothetical protein [Moorena sp. SIOASIH]NEO42049.1 hypothetical protein [Moorena sp. SIOASIH]